MLRARGQIVAFAAMIAGVLVLFSQRHELFPGYGTPARIATVAALVILGWGLARSLGARRRPLPCSGAWTPARRGRSAS